MPCVLLIRPLEDALPLSNLLKYKGIKSIISPLFKPYFFPLPPLENLQALIITSKNALRALEGQESLKSIPLYVVGDQTAELAQGMGFLKIFSASGTSKDLTELISREARPDGGKLAHLSGEIVKGHIVETLQNKGFQAERHIVYGIEEAESLSADLLSALQARVISHVMFFSPQTTRIFVTLLKKRRLEELAYPLTSLCLSQDVAEMAARLKWKDIWISPLPTPQSMTGYFDEDR